MKKRRSIFIRVLDALAILLFIATFSPIVIPQGQTSPYLLGIPFTMWVSFVVSVVFVVLAYLVSLMNKEDNHAD